jgi:hypothetical protein
MVLRQALFRASFAPFPVLLLVVLGVSVSGAACCKICETPDAGTAVPPATTSYSCAALTDDSTAAACIGGPPPTTGGPPPDPDKRFPLGCSALGATGKPGVTQNCTCQATSSVVDGHSQPIWACPT